MSVNHLDIVKRVRAQYPTPLWPCNPDCLKAICRAIMQDFDERPGLLSKTSGTQLEGFATDIICYPDGRHYDVFLDGEGAAAPCWADKGFVDPDRYVAVEGQPVPPDLAKRVAVLERDMAALITYLDVVNATTLRDGEKVTIKTDHGRYVRAGNAGEDWRMNQAEKPASWERFTLRRAK